jgi:CDP-diglyceride synthetase
MNSSKWADLPLRVISGGLLLLILFLAMWSGTTGLLTLMFICAVIMHWEMGQMFGASNRRLFAICSVAALGWLPLIVQPTALNSGFFFTDSC